jgi:hypothetical protein
MWVVMPLVQVKCVLAFVKMVPLLLLLLLLSLLLLLVCCQPLVTSRSML